MIHCPCRTCKNLRVFSDTTIVRSHVLISGFVDNYMIWNKHGEEEQPQRENSIDEIMQEPEFNVLFDAFDDAGCEDEGVGGVILILSTGVPSILVVIMIAMNLMMVIF